MWKLNSMPLSKQLVKKKIKTKIKKYISRERKIETQYIKTYGMQQKQY